MLEKAPNEKEIKVLRGTSQFNLFKKDSFKLEIPNLIKFKRYSLNGFKKENSGVYALMLNKEVYYIGKTVNISKRLKQHSKQYKFDEILFYPLEDVFQRSVIEAFLIYKYKPIENKRSNFLL